MSWKCQHLGIQPASSRLWFWEIAQQPYETMCPDLWFGEQGHCVHDSKKLPSKPRKLATEVQGTESPSSSFTLGQVHDCWERELGGPWSSLSPPFPEDEAVPEVLSTCPPPPRALRGRIHSQDHGFQAFDWQSLFGHFLGQVHQPGGKGGRVIKTEAPSGEGVTRGRLEMLDGQRLPSLPSCLSSGPAPPSPSPHILPEPKGVGEEATTEDQERGLFPLPSGSAPRPLEGRMNGGHAVVGRSLTATGLGALCEDGVWGAHGKACQGCWRPWP